MNRQRTGPTPNPSGYHARKGDRTMEITKRLSEFGGVCQVAHICGPSDNFLGAGRMNYAFPMEESDGKQQRALSADTGSVLALESGGCAA